LLPQVNPHHARSLRQPGDIDETQYPSAKRGGGNRVSHHNVT
jgi:hypothetical protein